MYDAACFITSTKEGGLREEYIEPSVELSFRNFAISLISKATLFVKNLKNQKGQKALDFWFDSKSNSLKRWLHDTEKDIRTKEAPLYIKKIHLHNFLKKNLPGFLSSKNYFRIVFSLLIKFSLYSII